MDNKTEKMLNTVFNILLLILLSSSIGVRKGLAIFLFVSIIADPFMRRFVLWRTLKSGFVIWLTNVILIELIFGAFGFHGGGIFSYIIFFASFIGAYKMNKAMDSFNGFHSMDMNDYSNDFDSRDDFYRPNNDNLSDYKEASQFESRGCNSPSSNESRPLWKLAKIK